MTEAILLFISTYITHFLNLIKNNKGLPKFLSKPQLCTHWFGSHDYYKPIFAKMGGITRWTESKVYQSEPPQRLNMKSPLTEYRGYILKKHKAEKY